MGRARQEAEDAKAALRLRLREAERQHQVRVLWSGCVVGHLVRRQQLWSCQWYCLKQAVLQMSVLDAWQQHCR